MEGKKRVLGVWDEGRSRRSRFGTPNSLTSISRVEYQDRRDRSVDGVTPTESLRTPQSVMDKGLGGEENLCLLSRPGVFTVLDRFVNHTQSSDMGVSSINSVFSPTH